MPSTATSRTGLSHVVSIRGAAGEVNGEYPALALELLDHDLASLEAQPRHEVVDPGHVGLEPDRARVERGRAR